MAIFFLSCATPALAQSQAQSKAQSQSEPETATGTAAKQLVRAEKHMVVAAHPLAAKAGRETLRKGGSAVDAAIATQMVLGLVEPQSSGLGGGGFLLHWDAATKKLTSHDGRETAPMAATGDMFLGEDGKPLPWPKILKSGRAVGVPGLVATLAKAHAAHGRLPWADIFAPAITLADNGFPVGKRLRGLLARIGAERFNPEARTYFFDEAGTPRPEGFVLKNPAYAETLRAIATRGAKAFYRGPVAEAIVRAVNDAPGSLRLMSSADLAGYQAKTRPPVCAPYRAWTICGMGPPSSGGLTVAQTLMLLDEFPLGREPLTRNALHLIGEAEKLAYADRGRYMADPDFVTVPSGLLDAGYVANRRALIAPRSAMAKATPGQPPGLSGGKRGQGTNNERPGTTHMSIIDDAGNALSMTTTIESAFGSGIMTKGFLLNNELTDFSWRPVDKEGRPVANRVEGGKRPRSSMAPTIVFDAQGKVRMVAGSPGGTRIILYVVKSLIAHLDWGLDAQRAAGLINFGHRNRGLYEIEAREPSAELAMNLKSLGHPVRISPMTSGSHIIIVRDGVIEGGADPRREGVALGD